MNSPQRFSELPEYAFPRLRTLFGDLAPGSNAPVQMTIGDPRHAPPAFVAEVIAEHQAGFMSYPPNDGAPELLSACAAWLSRRYGYDADPATDILALNGTREGLYNASMALCPETKNGQQPAILMPNPFYQVYAVSTLSVGAEPVYLNATEATGHLPDFDAVDPALLDRTAVVYICSPANPQGATASLAYWSNLLRLAEQHDFKIFADECYAEIYRDTPPTGVLEAVKATGADPERVVAFHSLSKRSNLAGLRSGFAVSGPGNIARMKQLRTYAGAPLPLPLQMAAARAWSEEAHVVENRALYAAKFDAAARILGRKHIPEAGFFLWLPTPEGMSGETAAMKLWTQAGVKVLPGAYLARDTKAGNPGDRYIRAALVAPIDETIDGLTRLNDCLYT
ncbi:aminotransferase class I/II-fold pyridoxal phosphate-dependent enzyme [Jannaschia pohangensis]|uniref:Aspartate/methionine/tyrosine aminotransferase n=1 Tax=Jannaschia pohangensis TaxID=390807 RepID=A0A1I3T6B3_9RHOB|nr:aminotransferase class I/II-fold pyridoxal phosphate-dependent enzyme [Jannaschia pohangensis]SFJ65351.1 Aspartate/methionine/tyrosine aminotransferase [Jannaschia pohangensis]